MPRLPAPASTAPARPRNPSLRVVLQRHLRALAQPPAPREPTDSTLPPAEASTAAPVARLGEYLCAHGLITEAILAAALSEQRQRLARGQPIALGDLLVEQGHLTAGTLVTVLMLQQLDRRQGPPTAAPPPLGELLVQAGVITTEQLGTALTIQIEARQRGEMLRLGQILIAAGALSRQTLATTLVQQRRARR